jgi:hypothetical protein
MASLRVCEDVVPDEPWVGEVGKAANETAAPEWLLSLSYATHIVSTNTADCGVS